MENHLSNEILAIIINELGRKRNKKTLAALASCRLAADVLRSLATPILFSSMQLTDKAANFFTKTTELSQILTNNNDIAASVQTFKLYCRRDYFFSRSATVATLITAILHRLQHIRTFIFKAVAPMHDRYVRFSTIPQDLASAIQTLCRSPNIRTLDFYNIKDLPVTFITAPGLRSLRLKCIELSYDADESSSKQLFNLDSLEIDHSSLASLNDITAYHPSFAEYFSRLKNFQVRNLLYRSEPRPASVWEYLALGASQSLTTIDIKLDTQNFSRWEDVDSFDLGRLSAIRHFKIHLTSFRQNGDLLRFLNQLLSISSPIGLETLEIEITWHYDLGRDVLSSEGWFTLDEALISDKFVSLSKVVFDLRFNMRQLNVDKSEEIRLTLSCVDDLFPMLRACERTLEINVRFP